MKQQRLTGPDAGVLKYDVLTALSLIGLVGSATMQTSMMRLIALITARYNWRLDEFSVGQRDMARMWGINERSVKREVKRLTEAEIIICKRSGVRGRVGAYRLNFPKIASLTEPSWATVGYDFEDRMRARYPKDVARVVQLRDFQPPSMPTPSGPWGRAMVALAKEQPNLHDAWFKRVEFVDYDHGTLRLQAPSSFVQRYIETHLLTLLTDMVENEFGPLQRVCFVPNEPAK